jgi:hypothetical protein
MGVLFQVHIGGFRYNISSQSFLYLGSGPPIYYFFSFPNLDVIRVIVEMNSNILEMFDISSLRSHVMAP